MYIQAIDKCCPKPRFAQNLERESNRSAATTKVKGDSLHSAVGTSALLGATATGVAVCCMRDVSKRSYLKAGLLGTVVALAALALTLHAKVFQKGFEKVKEQTKQLFDGRKNSR